MMEVAAGCSDAAQPPHLTMIDESVPSDGGTETETYRSLASYLYRTWNACSPSRNGFSLRREDDRFHFHRRIYFLGGGCVASAFGGCLPVRLVLAAAAAAVRLDVEDRVGDVLPLAGGTPSIIVSRGPLYVERSYGAPLSCRRPTDQLLPYTVM